MNEIYKTVLLALISVSALFVLGRLMGKKQIAQLTFFDYIIGISIGSVAAQIAVDRSVPFAHGMIVLVVFTLFSIALSYISDKSYLGRKILDGTPTVLIENGKIIEKGLKTTKLNVNDLLEECRQKDVFDIAEIEFAILETSGRLSVLLQSSDKPLTPRDMNIQSEYKGLCTNVIIDGKIIYEDLHAINLDKNWLYSELEKQNNIKHSDVMLAYVSHKGVLHVHMKNVKATTQV